MADIRVELFIIFLLSYIIGSISPSLLVGKLFYKTDIRDFGSKNLGGSNAGRVLGKKIGILVIILDLLKGFFAVWLTVLIFNSNENVALSGLSVILGHLFPLFARFRGGKGVATTGGVLFFIKPILVPISLALILLFWIVSKYESLAAIITFTFLFIITLTTTSDDMTQLLSIIVYVGVIYAHRFNIVSIMQKTEKKKNIFSKFD